MKSSIIYFTVLLLIILTAVSCREDFRWVKGEGPNVTNTRMPSGFNGISLDFDADVEVYHDSVFRVELIGQQNILNLIETNSDNSTLRICLAKHTTIRRHNPITVKVYMPTVNSLDICGSGDISCSDDFICNDLNTNISGSGSISFSGDIYHSFNANISGSGSINNYSNSSCQSAKYTISGSGNISAEWLRIDDADARISGSGDMRMYAVRNLNAHISGSGDIYYRGSPSINIQISGSGKLRAIQ